MNSFTEATEIALKAGYGLVLDSMAAHRTGTLLTVSTTVSNHLPLPSNTYQSHRHGVVLSLRKR